MAIQTTRLDAVVASPPFSRVSWGGILAGTICAFAVQLLLNIAGLGLGLAVIDLTNTGDEVGAISVGAGIYWAVSSIISLIIGGWVAGRLAGVPIRLTAMIHGFSVWALATLFAVFLATTSIATAVSGAFGAVGQIGEATAGAVSGGARALSNAELPADVRATLQDVTNQRSSVRRSIRNEARDIVRSVVSRPQQEAAEQAVSDTARNIARNPGSAGRELNALVDRLFSSDGVFTKEDRQEALQVMEERLGVDAEEADRVLANWENRYQNAVAEVDQTIENVKQEAMEAADAAADAVGAAAGWTALAMFLSLVAAVFGGLLGKPEPWMVEVAEEEMRDAQA